MVIRVDRIRNECTRGSMTGADIFEKIRGNRLRLNGHVDKRKKNVIIKKVKKIRVEEI